MSVYVDDNAVTVVAARRVLLSEILVEIHSNVWLHNKTNQYTMPTCHAPMWNVEDRRKKMCIQQPR